MSLAIDLLRLELRQALGARMLSAWTSAGHLLLRGVDDSSGALASLERVALEPNPVLPDFYCNEHVILDGKWDFQMIQNQCVT
jgi:hypothetical protein